MEGEGTSMPDDMSANLIRAYCDGQMEPAQAAALEQRMMADPQLRKQVEFERQLRQCVSRVMSEEAPQGLSDQVQEAMASDRMQLASSVKTPRRASLLAIAATIALVAGAVLYGIFGPRLDDQQLRSSDLVVDQAYEWAAAEHGRCAADDEVLGTKILLQDRSLAEADLSAWLGVQDVSVFDLSGAGYQFLGAGHCMVPGSASSGHMVYRRMAESHHPPLVSLFVVPDRGQFQSRGEASLRPGEWRRSGIIEGCDVEALQGTDGTLAYMLVCCDERDLGAVSQAITQQMALD